MVLRDDSEGEGVPQTDGLTKLSEQHRRAIAAGAPADTGVFDWARPEPERTFRATSDKPERLALAERALRDRREAGCIRPGSRRFAACVRLWSAAKYGLEEEIVPALREGAVVDHKDYRSIGPARPHPRCGARCGARRGADGRGAQRSRAARRCTGRRGRMSLSA
jgi:hypothetical protein